MVKDERRDRRVARRGRRGRRDRGRAARAPVRRPERARRASRARRAHARARARALELRDRRGRRTRRPARTTSRRPTGESPDGDIVLCDFGGTMHGYCSDITRMFHAGEPPTRSARRLRRSCVEAQEAGVRAATVGTPCAEVDAAARRVIERGRARRVLHASCRPRHRPGGARGSLHGRRATIFRSRPGTRSASSRASTSRDGSACDSKTSWSRPTRGRSASTTRRAISRSSADRKRPSDEARRRDLSLAVGRPVGSRSAGSRRAVAR